MKKKLLILFGTLGAILVTAGIVIASLYYIDNKREGFASDFVIYVYPDTTPAQILEELCEEGRALSRRSVERCFGEQVLLRESNRVTIL